MSASKHIRKNQFKRRRTNRTAGIKTRLLLVLKAVAVFMMLAIVSLVFILGHDFLTQWHYFDTDHITVSGLSQLSPRTVMDQAGIARGVNLLAVNLSLTRKRLLAHPWIVQADVSRRLPNRLDITVQEHRPLAVINLGRRFIINANGDIFKEWEPSDPTSLPVISGLEFSDLSAPGEQRSAPLKAVMSVLHLGAQTDSVLPNRLIRKIHVDREIGLTLQAFAQAKTIEIGYHHYPLKYSRFKNILFHLKNQHQMKDFESIDLKNENRIVVTPARVDSSDEDAMNKDHKEV